MSKPTLTKARVEKRLSRMKLKTRKRDGWDEIILPFPTTVLFIHVDQVMLRVTGKWHGEATTEKDRSLLWDFAATINRSVLYPKAFIPEDTGDLMFQSTLFAREGMDDDQLDMGLQALISLTLHVAEDASERFSGMVLAAKEDNS